jgi:hypothetical protein
MTHYYSFPDDIYCWGQNRGGTLVPLVAQLFNKVLAFSAINSVSLANYLLLLIGFFGFSHALKNNFTKIIFAACWFLPPVWFIDSLRFPYGIQYCLIGAAVFIVTELKRVNDTKSWRYHTYIILLIISLTCAVWVSDLASVTVVVLLITLFVFHIKNKGFSLPRTTVIIYTLGGLLLSALFIIYAKSKAVEGNSNYLGINNLSEAYNGIRITKDSIVNLLLFRKDLPLMSLYLYLIIALALIFIFLFLKYRASFTPEEKFWFFFFTLDAVLVFMVILFSRWALYDGYGRRFFICTYISVLVLMMIVLDQLITHKIKFLMILVICVATTGSLSTLHFLKFVEPQTLKPKMDVLSDFKTLGKCGIIGNYWSVYLISATDPVMIKGIPHQDGGGRNDEIVKEVFQMEYVYLMKDNWLETFPPSIAQYWHLLYKDGEEFKLAGKTLCRYRKIN